MDFGGIFSHFFLRINAIINLWSWDKGIQEIITSLAVPGFRLYYNNDIWSIYWPALSGGKHDSASVTM